MEADSATVDCVNFDRCGGRVTLRLMGRQELTATDRSDATFYVWEEADRTCGCEYSEDDKETIEQRVRLALERGQ